MKSLPEKRRGVGADRRRLFTINRVLILVMVAAILLGLTFDQWGIVLRNAILL
jgi:hypothetical protein